MPRLLTLLALCLAASSAQARVHSNTQVQLPDNTWIGDLTADSKDDWILADGRAVFVARTNFEAHGYLYRKLPAKVERMFTGYFSNAAKQTLCAITSNKGIYCYGVSPDDTALWWAWTQPSFIAEGDEAFAGDYDGDGLDELLVYTPSSGVWRMYERAPGQWFKPHPNFSPGNLGTKYLNQQVRVGNFGDAAGEGTRDDLLLYDPQSRRFRRFSARVDRDGRTTFWWSFTTRTNLAGRDEEVTLADTDGDAFEELVLHDTKTGAYRFFEVSFGGGNLVPIAQDQGQLLVEGNTRLFWADTKHLPSEAGNSDLRDDALVYREGASLWSLFSARWDGAKKTYWWAYTQYALDLDADPDGDGIDTRYELGGLDEDDDTQSDEPLQLYGASPFVKDIFVEVDYMAAGPGEASNHIMKADAVNLAVAEMADYGINLHIFVDDQIPYTASWGTAANPFDWGTHFDPVKTANFTPSRWGLFHYCVFGSAFTPADGVTGYSGISRGIPGSDFIVTFGNWGSNPGTKNEQAGTFLHELGHNLGLRHGSEDDTNNKPNHLSVMNYDYQTIGVWRDGQARFIFSEADFDDLNEASLNENTGVTTDSSVPFRTLVSSLGAWFDVNAPINFDGAAGLANSASADINADGSTGTLAGGVDEFAAMDYLGGQIGDPTAVGTAGMPPEQRAAALAHLHDDVLPDTPELDNHTRDRLRRAERQMPAVRRAPRNAARTIQPLHTIDPGILDERMRPRR